MENDLNYLGKWKTTLIFRQQEVDLNFLVGKCNTTSMFKKMEHKPQYFRQMEDDLNFC